uniref:Uncharacterized protein n=1 Tax=Caenorhabditis japonica TaxID=281687 RepID=A0A8R1IB14_CAEJA
METIPEHEEFFGNEHFDENMIKFKTFVEIRNRHYEMIDGLNILNLDEVFVEQLNSFNTARDFILQSLESPTMRNWNHILDIVNFCSSRVHDISRGEHFRAMSYGAMRIVNTRMTDVLNVVLPIYKFMCEAIEKEEETLKKEKAEQEEEQKKKKQVEIAEIRRKVSQPLKNSSACKKLWLKKQGGIAKRAIRWLTKRMFGVRPF